MGTSASASGGGTFLLFFTYSFHTYSFFLDLADVEAEGPRGEGSEEEDGDDEPNSEDAEFVNDEDPEEDKDPSPDNPEI